MPSQSEIIRKILQQLLEGREAEEVVESVLPDVEEHRRQIRELRERMLQPLEKDEA
ncbi:MAG: hypothetical protein SNJ67_14505 [Chloracidobacterium sp.]|uniref:Uncharacterized protein n=1 Tax=Chloracidobacterium validum TaxID=2821543 RepID=A0ABX8BFY0_9BACT|nr:hypothetical protein [Chloracidobacterium validum]QUW04528.1 hypothetical protein J8C06_12130 [Chloracidobacterium validum]